MLHLLFSESSLLFLPKSQWFNPSPLSSVCFKCNLLNKTLPDHGIFYSTYIPNHILSTIHSLHFSSYQSTQCYEVDRMRSVGKNLQHFGPAIHCLMKVICSISLTEKTWPSPMRVSILPLRFTVTVSSFIMFLQSPLKHSIIHIQCFQIPHSSTVRWGDDALPQMTQNTFSNILTLLDKYWRSMSPYPSPW